MIESRRALGSHVQLAGYDNNTHDRFSVLDDIPMKAPAQLEELDLSGRDWSSQAAYPPLGFLPLLDAELGNGDVYGLYWPYGREGFEPIICDMLHDEWAMEVAFSSTEVFLEWLRLNDGMRGDVEIDDPQLCGLRFQRLKALLSDKPDEAVIELKRLCADLPESADYWFTLAGQLRRIGDHEEACRAAIRAVASNWAFGMPPQGALRILQSARGKMTDPLVQHSDKLTLTFGGAKENGNYDILKECIKSYLSSDEPVLGVLLNQNYGYLMTSETTAFQDRYGFNQSAWYEEHSKLCLEYLGDSRIRIN